MTPEQHIRANEIKATITSCQKELMLTVKQLLEDRIEELREEYDKL